MGQAVLVLGLLLPAFRLAHCFLLQYLIGVGVERCLLRWSTAATGPGAPGLWLIYAVRATKALNPRGRVQGLLKTWRLQSYSWY